MTGERSHGFKLSQRSRPLLRCLEVAGIRREIDPDQLSESQGHDPRSQAPAFGCRRLPQAEGKVRRLLRYCINSLRNIKTASRLVYQWKTQKPG
jgi:hypothetical protein